MLPGIAVLLGALLLIPVVARAAAPADEPLAGWVAPYVELGRQSLDGNDDSILPHYRYVGTLCAGDSVALLFERRVFPYLTTSRAYAVNGNWPPADSGAFGGAFDVEDFAQSLADDLVPSQTWAACEPR
jgi:hypothetical protein